jgi:tRNA (guanine10-N2)-dimethyltransferase
MKCIFLLSKENIDLTRAEVLALTKSKKYELISNLLFVESSASEVEELSKRLAYTNSIYKLLFSASEKRLIKKLEKYAWQRIYKKDFSLRIHNFTDKKLVYSEAELAGYVWRKIRNPKVNLTNPTTQITLFFTNKKSFCSLSLKNIRKSFSRRKPHLRPGFAPTSLSPKLARCLINLAGIKKGAVVDPFCGTGGVLIEAGLIGLKPVGYDIDEAALSKCRRNLKFYGIRKYQLKKADATKINQKINYLVTDLPYGRNTKVEGSLVNLYMSFLKALKKSLNESAVVVFPDFVNYKELIKKAKLEVKKEFSYYIHKSLTKKIVMLV